MGETPHFPVGLQSYNSESVKSSIYGYRSIDIAMSERGLNCFLIGMFSQIEKYSSKREILS